MFSLLYSLFPFSKSLTQYAIDKTRCNNLVEVTCRYPTKVLTYVTLIDSNNCTSHDIDLSGFDKSLVQNKLGINFEPSNKSTPFTVPETNFKLDKHITDTQKSESKDMSSSMAHSLSAIQASAIELRKMQLSRISESSAMQDIPAQTTEGTKETLDAKSQKMSLQRKASFDSKVKPETISRGDTLNGVLDPDTVERKEKQNKKKELTRTQTEGQTIQLMKQQSNHHQGLANAHQSPYNIIRQKSQTNNMTVVSNTSIDPSQVFLHLFQACIF